MNRRPGDILLPGAIAALALAVYLNSLPNDFIWDDTRAISRNYLVKGLRHVPRIFVSDLYSGTGEPAGNYRPLLLTSFALDYAVFGGPRPWAFRSVNLVLHALASVLLYLLLRRLLGGSREVPALGALLFAVHPVHAEAVGVVMGRAELLAACLLLGGWLVYLHRGRGALPMALLFYFLALLSKETAAIFPVLLGAGAALQGEDLRRVVRDVLLFCAVFLIYIPIRLQALGGFTPPEGQVILPGMGLLDRVGVMLPVLSEYVALAQFPVKQSLDYQFLAEPGRFGPGDIVFGALLLVGFAVAVVAAWRRRSPLGLALILFLVPLIPVSNLIPLGEILGERLLYLPSAGLCLLVALLAARMPRPARWGMIGVILICYGTLTVRRNATLADQGSAALYTLRHYPASYKAHADAGGYYRRRGDLARSREHYESALALKPKFRIPRIGLGRLLLEEGKVEAAERHFRDLREAFPSSSDVLVNLGEVLLRKGEREEARVVFQRALELRESDPEPRANLGVMAYIDGDREGALRLYEEVLAYHPDHVQTLQNLGAALYEMERYAEAARLLRRAVRWGDATPGVWMIIGACEEQAGKSWRAARAFEEVLRLDPDPTTPGGIFNRARALDYLGRPKEAVEAYNRFLGMEREGGDKLEEVARERIRTLGG